MAKEALDLSVYKFRKNNNNCTCKKKNTSTNIE